MFQIIVERLYKRRHFWRYATFSEVAELYASRTMRLLALRMVSLFIALFMYQSGYSLLFIAGYFAAYFSLKALISYPVALLTARFGPKHGILVSNLLYIPALVAFTFVPEYGLPALIAFGCIQACSVTLYDLCYLVSFSKVKSSVHAGKELGYMQILEKMTAALSPLIGGAIAFLWGVEVTMWIAATLFALASWPLLRSAESVKTNQTLSFSGFPWRTTWRSLRAEAAIGFDIFATGTVWTLFISIVIFSGSGDDLYLKVGALASITFVTSIVAARMYGRLIDRRRGRELLQYSVYANTLIHLVRPLISTPTGIALVNVANETATTGYSMAFTRGMFDTADLTGKRIAYVFLIEAAVNVGSLIACVAFGASLLLFSGDSVLAMKILFAVTAIITLLIAAPRFQLYRK